MKIIDFKNNGTTQMNCNGSKKPVIFSVTGNEKVIDVWSIDIRITVTRKSMITKLITEYPQHVWFLRH